MTVLFVLCTLALFLAIDFSIQRAKEKRLAQTAGAAVREFTGALLPDRVGLALNHTWTRSDGSDVVTVGVDALLSHLIGPVDRLVLPAEGLSLNSPDRVVRLGAAGRSLSLSSPVFGKVLETNRELKEDPSLLAKDPYGRGWLYRVQTVEGPVAGPAMMHGAAAMRWLKEQMHLVREFLASRGAAEPAFAQDGGDPVQGVLRGFDRSVWKEFEQSFVSLPGVYAREGGRR